MIVRAKLAVPGARPGIVERARLHHALDAAAAGRLTVVQAAAGYGKTTAVASWLHASGRPAAWITLDRHDNEPRRLVAHVVAAVEALLPVGALHAAQLALDGGSSVELTVIPQLAGALDTCVPEQLTIVLDDFHVIDVEAARTAVRGLLDLLPATVHFVVTTRTRPALRMARRIAAGEATVIGPEQLAFAREEAGLLLNDVLGAGLAEDELREVVAGLHGWATGLRLLATALELGSDGARSDVFDALASLTRGKLVDYVIEEVLADADPAQRRFLLRTAVLPSFNGALADAVTEEEGALAAVERLRDEGQFVTADPEAGGWLRMHAVIRRALLVALERREPGLAPVLHARAAAWLERHGMVAEAIEHAITAEDHAQLAQLLREHGMALALAQRTRVLRDAFEVVGASGRDDPQLAAIELLVRLHEGVAPRLLAPEMWRLHERCNDRLDVQAITSLFVASPTFGDVRRSIAAGLEALDRFRDQPQVVARLAPVVAATLMRDDRLAEARALVHTFGSGLPGMDALGQGVLATISAIEEDAAEAEWHARRAIALLESSGLETAAGFWMMRAGLADALRVAGRLDEARAHLDASLDLQRRRPGTIAHAGFLLADVRLALAERRRAQARKSLLAARAILDTYPDVGSGVRAQIELLTAELATPADAARRGSAPTEAELRVLAELARTSSRAQIAAVLYLSESTVKSHLRRLYRRLGADSRATALAAARERGLLSPDHPDARAPAMAGGA